MGIECSSNNIPQWGFRLAIASVIAILGLYKIYTVYRQRADDQEIGRLHGCKPAPRLQNQRPFGVDRLEQIFRANAESRLMELFLFHFRQTGYTLEQVFLGTQAFGTVDPANMEAILSTDFKEWSMGLRREISFPMFGDGIFTQEGESWKNSREMLRPQFHFKQYADLEMFEGAVDDLIEQIDGRGVVDLQPLFFRFTLDTTTAFLFGNSVGSLKSPASAGEDTFAESFNLAQEYVVNRFRLLDLYWLIGGSKFRDACRKVHHFADQIIDKSLALSAEGNKESKYVFLQSLAEKTQDRAALRGQIINILAAGRDTTACLLSWTFFLLVRHPQVLNKLRAEIEKTCDGSSLNRDTLRSMTYLQNIMKETLRLYPSLPVNNRTALKTTVLPTGGGPDRKSPVLIPKGSVVAYSVYTMHRRPDIYGLDAELFRPERWDEDMPMKHDPVLSKWGYLPFNGGPRICLGLDFALTEAGYTIVRLLQHFDTIRLPPGTVTEITGVEKQTMTLVLTVAEGCRVDLG